MKTGERVPLSEGIESVLKRTFNNSRSQGAAVGSFFDLSTWCAVTTVQFAEVGCMWTRLKWGTIPFAVFVLFRESRYMAIVATLGTPLISGLLNAPAEFIAGLVGCPSQVGIVQQRFLEGLRQPNKTRSLPVARIGKLFPSVLG